jgi:thiol-disulfide isomerase/thioredoxin
MLIIVAGLAAIVLLWEHDDADDRGTAPLAEAGMERFAPVPAPVPAPKISFEDGERTRLTLEDFHGRVVVLNFWATWCAPCVRELPSLDRLQKRLKKKGVKVVALSLDRGGPEAVREFFADNGIDHLDVYVDATMAAQAVFKIPGLPTTILIDREGRERGRLVGPADWAGKEPAELVLEATE